jgi:hypothetical protein
MIQVRLDSGADMASLAKLDKTLWAALACPTTGLCFDNKTLELIDTDKDGRIRASELIAATEWTMGLLKNQDHILRKSPALEIDAINDSGDEGKIIVRVACQLSTMLGKNDAKSISVDDIISAVGIYNKRAFNGDGVVTEISSPDSSAQALIKDIITCFGAETDRCRLPGVNREKSDKFFAEAKSFAEWLKSGVDDKKVLILGDATEAAAGVLSAIRSKVDDYFARCRLASFDSKSESLMNMQEKEYTELAAKTLSANAPEIAALPIAMVKAGRPLPLDNSVNPAWAESIAKFRKIAAVPVLGDCDSLTENDWQKILAAFEPYFKHQFAKPATCIEKLGSSRILEIHGSSMQHELEKMLADDLAEEKTIEAFALLEKLLRFHRDLYQLCVNFVNFSDFYCDGGSAIFRAGTLFIDQRSCKLCLKVRFLPL